MPRILLAALIGLLAAPVSLAEGGSWRDGNGAPIADSESMRSTRGFAGAVLATTDEDWEAKWDTPPEVKPNFNQAETVPVGKAVYILIFFANPGLDRQGNADVRCDVSIRTPAGGISFQQKDLPCHAGPLQGNPHHVRLAAPTVTFSGDPGDPPGRWSFEVVLRDAVRALELPLRTSVVLQ